MSEENARNEEDVAAPRARPLLWADSPRRVEWVVRALMVLCALLVLFELVWHRHAYVPGESMFGYHAIVGFFAFMWIVLGAKGLRRLIRRDEDYYGASSVNAERYPEGGLERRDARETGEPLLRVVDGEVVDTLAPSDADGAAGRRGPREGEGERR